MSGALLPGGVPSGRIRASDDASGLTPPVAGVQAPEDQFPGGPVDNLPFPLFFPNGDYFSRPTHNYRRLALDDNYSWPAGIATVKAQFPK